jgi:WD40 repeat protein
VGSSQSQLVAELIGHTDVIHSAVFSPDRNRIVTASSDGTARVWVASSGQLLAELIGQGGRVLSASFSRDRDHVVTVNDDGSSRLWNLASLPGEAETIRHWVEVYTGTELKGAGVRPLSLTEWR